jgi:hypothetical protein
MASTSQLTNPRQKPDVLHRYPFVPWRRLKPLIQWTQGQMVVTVGGTGSGKTTIMGELLPRRKLVVVCVSKGMDEVLTGPYFSAYARIQKWPPSDTDEEKVMLWPAKKATIAETKAHKTTVFRGMFDDVLLNRGYWCIGVDETHYMADTLKLSGEITDVLEQGRSHKISMWNNTQRPAGIPLSVYVNSSHGFFFQTQEEYDVQRLGRIINTHTNSYEMMANIQRLDTRAHEFIYMDKGGRIPPVRSIVQKG